MQKSSFLQNSQEVPVVQFSKLDENNKAEFLQFLIKNNITFDNAAGKQNVVAKVTLKTLTPNKNVTNKGSNNQNIKTMNNKKVQSKAINIKYEDKQNNQNFHINKRPQPNNKTPFKNQPVLNHNKKNIEAVSPFKKVKLVYKQEQQIRKLNQIQNIRDSSISLKNQTPKENNKNQTMNIELRQRTLDKKNQTLISPAKYGKKMNEKSSEKLISIKDSNISPAKSARNVSYTKESHQKLSNFKKENLPKTMRQSQFLQQSRDPIYIAKDTSVNKRQKVRNKVPVQSKLNDSRQSISFSKQVGGYPMRNQSFQSLNRLQLVNKYKQYFNNFNSSTVSKSPVNSCIRQRPICWPLTQIERFLDEFYDDNFIKNTNQILNGSKKLNESLKKGVSSKSSHLAESLQKFLNKKFNKVQKAIEYNLINLLYSVAYYINEFKDVQGEQQNGSIIQLVLFEDFLSQRFQLEDYLFFLFCRNILKQQFKKCFIPSSTIVNINKKEIDRFLKHIVGQNNTQILQQYHKMIFQKVLSYEIEISKFMKILIEDYKSKRQAAEQSHRQKKHIQRDLLGNILQKDQFECDEDSSLQNTFNKIMCLDIRNDPKGNIFENSCQMVRQDSMQELTFGEDTKDMLREVDIQTSNQQQSISRENCLQFWQSPYINEKNTKAQKQRLLRDEFNQMIAQKLCQKTHQLVQILSSTAPNDCSYRSRHNNDFHNRQQHHNDTYTECQQQQEQNQWQQVQQLLFSKALCLFFTVIEMNKVKWLKELYIVNPTQEDVEKVEEIQLLFRKIKEFPSAKDIAEFCKLILTVGQITQQLSRFFV